MFKAQSFLSALAIVMSAGMFIVGAMPAEKGGQSTMAAETAAPVASEAPSGKKLKPQTTCPVMGGKIDKKVFTDYEGKRIFFCCPGCIETFKKEPAKYLKMLADQGESVEVIKALKPQTTCPVMGGKIDKKVFTDYDGKRVYFCCPGCIDTFKKDPAKYLKKMQEAGEEPEVLKK
jgi:YHS domain-containing protein